MNADNLRIRPELYARALMLFQVLRVFCDQNGRLPSLKNARLHNINMECFSLAC